MAEQRLLLCRYRYDPLDRLAGQAQGNEAGAQFFYRNSRLATQIQGTAYSSILQVEGRLLAQQDIAGPARAALLAVDRCGSVLYLLSNHQRQARAYTAYGHRPAGSGLSSLAAFNGERLDPLTGHYLLGNGYRAFNPVLLRFNSPDSLSPFAAGGLNAYAYCQGDPVNYLDLTGAVRTPPRLPSPSRVNRRAPLPAHQAPRSGNAGHPGLFPWSLSDDSGPLAPDAPLDLSRPTFQATQGHLASGNSRMPAPGTSTSASAQVATPAAGMASDTPAMKLVRNRIARGRGWKLQLPDPEIFKAYDVERMVQVFNNNANATPNEISRLNTQNRITYELLRYYTFDKVPHHNLSMKKDSLVSSLSRARHKLENLGVTVIRKRKR